MHKSFINSASMVIQLVLTSLVVLGASHTVQAVPWQQTIEEDGIQLFDPLVEVRADGKLEIIASVSFEPGSPGDEPIVAAARFEASPVQVGDERMLHDMTLLEVRYARDIGRQASRLNRLLESALARHEWPVPVTAVTGYLPPPMDLEIIWSKQPAILLPIEGKPDIVRLDEELVTVRNALLTVLGDGNAFYLLIGTDRLFTAINPLGPWVPATSLPGIIAEAFGIDSIESDSEQPIRIITATRPTALILSDGPPAWLPLADSTLLYLSNSEDNIYLDTTSGAYYGLLEDNWYTGPTAGTDWHLIAADELPASFAAIDPAQLGTRVVAGLPRSSGNQVTELASALPQVARVDAADESFSPDWYSEPDFEWIDDQQTLAYAINASNPILRIDNRYYSLDNGIWFQSFSPFGPWRVATSVPEGLYAIPHHHPLHHLTGVRLLGRWDDDIYFRRSSLYQRTPHYYFNRGYYSYWPTGYEGYGYGLAGYSNYRRWQHANRRGSLHYRDNPKHHEPAQSAATPPPSKVDTQVSHAEPRTRSHLRDRDQMASRNTTTVPKPVIDRPLVVRTTPNVTTAPPVTYQRPMTSTPSMPVYSPPKPVIRAPAPVRAEPAAGGRSVTRTGVEPPIAFRQPPASVPVKPDYQPPAKPDLHRITSPRVSPRAGARSGAGTRTEHD